MNGNVAGMVEMRNGYRVLIKKDKAIEHLENLGVDKKILKKRTLKWLEAYRLD
jgi:hypothetical protein